MSESKKQATPAAKAMVVAGVMSGTSADGIDVAVVRITPSVNADAPRIKLLKHVSFPYSKQVRQAVLASMDASSISNAELTRLHWRLGQLYGDAVAETLKQLPIRAELAAIHGQTVFHQGAEAKYLGAPVRCTLQLGEASEVAARTGIPVVSDFRTADMAVGGQGAPLVPMLDRVLYAHPKKNRVLQNLGGIANMTAIPAASSGLLAFDSGPANMVIDGCMERLFNRRFDRNGATSAKGNVLRSVLEECLRHPYFKKPAPKSCGREEFGRAFVSNFLEQCRKASPKPEDAIATATTLTAQSILRSYADLVWPFLGQHAPLADTTEYIVAGGGARNRTLMNLLRRGLEPLGVVVRESESTGLPPEAKEAVAFALLAWLRWDGMPGNVPAATGAARAVSLGKVTLP